MATKDTVVQELVVNTLTHKQFKAAQEAGTLSPYELYGTPDTSVRLPVLTPMWFDHITNDVSWLRADTFSWQSGDVYKAAYEHLVNEVPENSKFTWVGTAGKVYYTDSAIPNIGDTVRDDDGTGYVVGGYSSIDQQIEIKTVLDEWIDDAIRVNAPFNRDVVGDVEIIYYQADDGHKICLPDQESNISALYESAGVAWYYLLDTENKQFKLPRTKYGFVGMRDGVGNYVSESLPNITASFSNSAFSGASGKANQTSGAAYATNLGNSVYSGSGGGSSNSLATTNIDASRSSATYQDGAPVQQRATQMYLYFYVGNFEQDSVEQTAGLNAELFNGKLDLELGNATDETKTTIVGWGMPDYSAGVDLPISDSTITMPFTGFVIGKVYNNQDNSVGVYVDGKQILSGSTSYAGVKYWFFNLEKNQTLKIKTAYAMDLAVAFPFKGVN